MRVNRVVVSAEVEGRRDSFPKTAGGTGLGRLNLIGREPLEVIQNQVSYIITCFSNLCLTVQNSKEIDEYYSWKEARDHRRQFTAVSSRRRADPDRFRSRSRGKRAFEQLQAVQDTKLQAEKAEMNCSRYVISTEEGGLGGLSVRPFRFMDERRDLLMASRAHLEHKQNNSGDDATGSPIEGDRGDDHSVEQRWRLSLRLGILRPYAACVVGETKGC